MIQLFSPGLPADLDQKLLCHLTKMNASRLCDYSLFFIWSSLHGGETANAGRLVSDLDDATLMSYILATLNV